MRDERHDREVGNRRINRLAGAQWYEAAPRHTDLLSNLALSRLPGGLAFVDAAARQRDLPWVIPEIGTAPHEGHLPAPAGFVEDECDSGFPGAPTKLAPAAHRMEQAFEASEEAGGR